MLLFAMIETGPKENQPIAQYPRSSLSQTNCPKLIAGIGCYTADLRSQSSSAILSRLFSKLRLHV